MSDDQSSPGPVDVSDSISRIRRVRDYISDRGFPYIDIRSLYKIDPQSERPYTVPETFIPERIGGRVTVVSDSSTAVELSEEENLNQMLRSFLPGGYQERWDGFSLWRGAWSHKSEPGHADIGPMFEWAKQFPITELLEDASDIEYTDLSFDTDEVMVYVPQTIKVTKENKRSPNYVWIPKKGLVWTGYPPQKSEPLSSDPTTDTAWFKHTSEELGESLNLLPDASLISGFEFRDGVEFHRCYYATYLTLYPKNSTKTKSEIIQYRCEEDDAPAFVATKEYSQLLTFELDRSEVQSRIQTALDENDQLKRDLRFAFLQSLIWKRLFHEKQVLSSKFAVDPVVKQLLGADYQAKVVKGEGAGIFALSEEELIETIQALLPANPAGGDQGLRLLGYESAETSDTLDTIKSHVGDFKELLSECSDETLLEEFAERVVVHSAEHALSTWSNNLTGSGTSFELWYNVNFQTAENEGAQIAVYDPIQGGSGIAKEVYEQVDQGRTNLEVGLGMQGHCHSAKADQGVINLLTAHSNRSLYDIYNQDYDRFSGLVETEVKAQLEDAGSTSISNLGASIEQRIRALFETRDLAAFYSYIAEEYTELEAKINRTPRVVDLALHLDRHIFRDPRIRSMYDKFTDDSGHGNAVEIDERLGELTIQCVTACPDCIKTKRGLCLHGQQQQETRLNRQILAEVFR